MTLQKAIEIARSYIITRNATLDPQVKESIRLGIEAMKHHKKLRDAPPDSNYKILPGETSLKPLSALGFNTGDDESP